MQNRKKMQNVQRTQMGQMRKKASVVAFTREGSALAVFLCRRFSEIWGEEECWEIQGFVPERFWCGEWQQKSLLQDEKTERQDSFAQSGEAEQKEFWAQNRKIKQQEQSGKWGVDEADRVRIQARTQNLAEWTAEQFASSDALIFIGAAGIAVRAIAPFVKDKLKDPAVLVIDEKAQYVIPLLSGHVGGANLLAEKTARLLEAVPVITTATDVNGRFAVDVFAVKNHLSVWNRDGIRQISGALLEGKTVGLFVDGAKVEGELPEGLCLGKHCEKNIYITAVQRADWMQEARDGRAILLIPRNVTLGIGCRRGVAAEVLERKVRESLSAYALFPEAVCQVASVDKKRDETGLLELTQQYNWKFVTFSAKELQAAAGEFQESEFVKNTIGVGNVCERAAVLASGGVLRMPKQAGEGVTVAAAWDEIRISFGAQTAEE